MGVVVVAKVAEAAAAAAIPCCARRLSPLFGTDRQHRPHKCTLEETEAQGTEQRKSSLLFVLRWPMQSGLHLKASELVGWKCVLLLEMGIGVCVKFVVCWGSWL